MSPSPSRLSDPFESLSFAGQNFCPGPIVCWEHKIRTNNPTTRRAARLLIPFIPERYHDPTP